MKVNETKEKTAVADLVDIVGELEALAESVDKALQAALEEGLK